MEISLCMIVKNEEEVLEACLSSVVAACDEIIIVDTGSTDKTKEIAARFTDKIFDFEWIDDFSAARNFAFLQGSKDYLFWLDADDILQEDDLEKLIVLKKQIDTSVDSVTMLYNIAFDEQGKPTFSYRRNRIVKKSNNFRWIGAVHEYLSVGGSIFDSEIAITHNKLNKTLLTNEASERNIRIYENLLKKESDLNPRDKYYYANELREHGRYHDAIHWYERFLNEGLGWKEDNVSACFSLADAYEQLGDTDKSVESTFRALTYGLPKPEACSRTGDIFMRKGDYYAAVFWYTSALRTDLPKSSGFDNLAYSTWYPHLQLCVAYFEANDIQKARYHNLEAEKYLPNDSRVKENNDFFKSYLETNS